VNENRITAEEMFESLTGFDEIAIHTAFGAEIFALMDTKPTTATRALVFVAKRREGMSDYEAKNAVLGMSLKEVTAYFEDDEEVTPDEPVTASGEGDSLPV
jgi:hypothetical protein